MTTEQQRESAEIDYRIGQVIEELEGAIMERSQRGQIEYSDVAFHGAVTIFTNAILSRMFNLYLKEGLPQADIIKMATACGESIHKLVKTYTDIDMKNLAMQLIADKLMEND